MLRKSLKGLGVLVGVLAVVALGFFAYAEWVLERDYSHVALPAIRADRSPAAVARGELLFQSLCMECHGGQGGRATGKRLDEVPAFLGTFWSANLAHPEHGVHSRSDGQLARVLRNGVLPDGRLSMVMSGFNKLGDADVAALLGYMRSGAPAFVPSGSAQPRSEPSLAAALIATYMIDVKADVPAQRVPVPTKARSVEYGRYMAQVMDCVGCHTEGFSADKLTDANAFGGGFELTDEHGAPIYTRNITFDEQTGIGRWSEDDLERALRSGVRPDGVPLRKPMPVFSRLDRTDVEALYDFLRSVPKLNKANKPGGQAMGAQTDEKRGG